MKKYSLYTLLGILFGLCFPLFSLLFSMYVANMDFSFQSLCQIHLNSPAHWLIDSTPLLLGGAFHLLGIKAIEHDLKPKSSQEETSLHYLHATENPDTEEEWIQAGEEMLARCVQENKGREALIFLFIKKLCHYLSASTTRLYVTDENEELCELQKYEIQEKTSPRTSSLLLLPIRPAEKTLGILEITSVYQFHAKEKQLIETAIRLIAPHIHGRAKEENSFPQRMKAFLK